MKKILLLMGFSAVMLTSLPGQARVFVAEPGVVVVAPRPAPVIVSPAAPVVVAPRPTAVYVAPVAPAAVYVEPRPVIVGGPVVRRWIR